MEREPAARVDEPSRALLLHAELADSLISLVRPPLLEHPPEVTTEPLLLNSGSSLTAAEPRAVHESAAEARSSFSSLAEARGDAG